jgi:hypothetical protein
VPACKNPVSDEALVVSAVKVILPRLPWLPLPGLPLCEASMLP